MRADQKGGNKTENKCRVTTGRTTRKGQEGEGKGWGEELTTVATKEIANIIEGGLGRCLSLNTAGLTDIKIAEYRQWFRNST